MTASPRISLALRVILGSTWAAVLILAGLWLGTGRLPEQFIGDHHTAARVLGVLLVALGQYVFADIVADRLFPKADQLICGAIRVLTGVVCLALLGYLIYYGGRVWAGIPA